MDKLKFEELYLSCRTALERFIYYKMASKSDAEDIIQEVAFAAYKNISEVQKPESFKSWLLKIAANKCNDFYRAIAKRHEIEFDEITDTVVSMSRYGVTEIEVVRDTLDNMADKDKQILFLYYFKNKPQAEIAQILNIPLGTVKSRLHTAKHNFKEAYPFPPKSTELSELKGDDIMKTLPDILPEYKITPSEKAPFDVRHEETPGFFIIPRLGEKTAWAIYEFADKNRMEAYLMEVTDKVIVHGIEGVEMTATEEKRLKDGGGKRTFPLAVQLTDTHCRFLATNFWNNEGIKVYGTFLDGDDFNMGYGDDNCGKEVNLTQKGIIKRNGSIITCPEDKAVTELVGRYDVEINGRTYDTVCFIDIEYYDKDIFSEQYIDKHGRTVLWRRFNKNDWKIKSYSEYYNFYNKLWSEMFPGNERVTVNGEIFVHWYDCITDYIL